MTGWPVSLILALITAGSFAFAKVKTGQFIAQNYYKATLLCFFLCFLAEDMEFPDSTEMWIYHTINRFFVAWLLLLIHHERKINFWDTYQ